METPVHPQSQDIEQIAASVFSTMLGLEFQQQGSLRPCPASPGTLTAAIHLDGTWQGMVLLHCREAQACEFAARFLGTPPPTCVTDDVRDVLGELANMIAGNLKCTLRPGIRLSSPHVLDGAAGCVCPSGTVICELGFETEDGPFWLSAVEGMNSAAALTPCAACPAQR
jgi:CheY-specific phosphatase CheX